MCIVVIMWAGKYPEEGIAEIRVFEDLIAFANSGIERHKHTIYEVWNDINIEGRLNG